MRKDLMNLVVVLILNALLPVFSFLHNFRHELI